VLQYVEAQQAIIHRLTRSTWIFSIGKELPSIICVNPRNLWTTLFLSVTCLVSVAQTASEKIVRILLAAGGANQIQARGCAAGEGRNREYAKTNAPIEIGFAATRKDHL